MEQPQNWSWQIVFSRVDECSVKVLFLLLLLCTYVNVVKMEGVPSRWAWGQPKAQEKMCVLCNLSVKTHTAATCVLEKLKRVIKCLWKGEICKKAQQYATAEQGLLSHPSWDWAWKQCNICGNHLSSNKNIYLTSYCIDKQACIWFTRILIQAPDLRSVYLQRTNLRKKVG